jgi:hypothetical protein
MTPVAEFNFDHTSTSLGVRWYRFDRRGCLKRLLGVSLSGVEGHFQ